MKIEKEVVYNMQLSLNELIMLCGCVSLAMKLTKDDSPEVKQLLEKLRNA